MQMLIKKNIFYNNFQKSLQAVKFNAKSVVNQINLALKYMELTNATVDKITVTNENIQMRLQLHFTFVLDTDDKLCETSILGF